MPDLSDEDRSPRGARAFDAMCTGCHGAPGREPFLGAGDMNPPPPDLALIAPARSPQELFWVIKNGLRMTGMPAWGPTHGDDQLWDLVAFMKRLAELTPEGYRALAAAPGDDGHDHGATVDADAAATAVDVPVAESAASGRDTHGANASHAH